jgi:hypothetical protein
MGRCRKGEGAIAIVCLPASNCVENTYDMVETEYDEGLY